MHRCQKSSFSTGGNNHPVPKGGLCSRYFKCWRRSYLSTALISLPKGKGERLYSGQAKRGAAEDRRTAEEEERGRSRGQEEDGGCGVVLFPFPLDLLRLPLWSSPIRFLITIAQSIAGAGAQQVARRGTITAGRMLLNIHQTQICWSRHGL